jgi:glucosamine-6-phosphate deaminase
MRIRTFIDRDTMSRAAAHHAAASLRAVLDAPARAGDSSIARIIAATGASQFGFLEALIAAPGIDWSRVELFHLDEYVGLPVTHAASFRKYLLERLIRPAGIRRYHLLDGEADPDAVRRDVGRALTAAPIDVAFVGIGENGHLAFNDPPADFSSTDPYLIVTLDDACKQQQVGEGWFARVEDVPSRAISMSIHQILAAREILCVVPDARKADAVRACLDGDVTPQWPASILRTHANTTLYLDRESASLLPESTRGAVLSGDGA